MKTLVRLGASSAKRIITTRWRETTSKGNSASLNAAEEFVHRRRWPDEHNYADLVALGQFLPGPASSQARMALGISRAGLWGALLGFTLPSALVLSLLLIV